MQFKTCFKKTLICIFFFVIFSEKNLYSLENKIILKIDNEIITSLDIENEVRYLKALNPKINNLDKKKINLIGKNSLIREKIKKKEILKYIDQIKLEKKYLDQLIKNRYSVLNLETKEKFLQYLKNYQVDINVIEEKITIEALWNQIIYSKFSSKLKIDKESLRKEIKKTINKKTKSYLLSEIIFNISDKKNLDNKYKEIKNVILNDGFESAALAYSISNTSELGGKLGWINEDSLNQKIKKKLTNLNKEEITKPIFTNNGYLILKIKDIRLIKKNFDEEKQLNKLIQFKTNQQLNQYSNNYFNKIKKDTNINEF